MSNCCIKLGSFNKKLSIPFLLALAQIIINIYNNFYYEENQSIMMDGCSEALGQIAIRIIPYIKCFSISSKDDKEGCQCSKKIGLHYFILLFLYTIDIVISFWCSILDERESDAQSINVPIFDLFSTKDGLQIILITIIARLLLKYEYFIHHYISIFLFLIFSVVTDFILKNYEILFHKWFLVILLNFLIILTKAAYYCYVKYMIDKHYQYYWNIMLALGITKLTIFSITLILMLNINMEDHHPKDTLEAYFKTSLWIIITKFIINFILQTIFYALQILTIFYLSPEFILISQNVARIIIFLKYGNDYKYYSILIFVFQFFSLMIYLEIIELNCLNLNNNTKRNIKLRIDSEKGERTESLEIIEFEVGNGYRYTIENEENLEENKNNINVEMKQFQEQ